MKNTIKIIAVAVVIICAVSCQKNSRPNYQYMPNMYESLSYETYGEYDVFEGKQEAMLPAEGSIPRGWKPYDFENSTAGYKLAKDTLKNPLKYTEENLEKGKALYSIYCAICHGTKGKGQGTLVKREKILGVPSYSDIGRAITEGSIYHVMFYGLNSMGSYASQTSEKERWQIVQYVESLKANLEGKTPRLDTNIVVVDTVKVAPTVEDVIEAGSHDHSSHEGHSHDH